MSRTLGRTFVAYLRFGVAVTRRGQRLLRRRCERQRDIQRIERFVLALDRRHGRQVLEDTNMLAIRYTRTQKYNRTRTPMSTGSLSQRRVPR
jgi:hypothetical protein